MGLFSKLFRRGGKNKTQQAQGDFKASRGSANGGGRSPTSSGSGSGGATNTSKNVVSRLRGRRINSSSSTPTDRDSPTELMNDAPPHHLHNGEVSAASSSSQRRAGPDLSEGSQRVRSPSQQVMPLSSVGNSLNSASSAPSSPGKQWQARSPTKLQQSSGPIDLDASDVESTTVGSRGDDSLSRGGSLKSHPRLSTQRLEEFDKQQQQNSSRNGKKSVPVFTMEDAGHIRFSAGQLMGDNAAGSEDESSSFNLSTDAEDTDYENLKKRGVLPPMDTSTYSGQYNTDGETSTSVFPNLPTDDEGMSLTTASKDGRGGGDNERFLSLGGGGGGNGARGGQDILSLSRASNDSSSIDAMAWAKDSSGYFDSSPSPVSAAGGFQPSTAFNVATVTTSANGATSTTVTRRSFTSPKKGAAVSSPVPVVAAAPTHTSSSQPPEPQQLFDEDFANFADFANVTFPSDPVWNASVPSTGATSSEGTPTGSHVAQARSLFEDKKPQASHHTPTMSSSASSSKKTPSTAVYMDTSLSELLAQAKSKSSRHRGGSGGRHGSNSVNSAPALTSAYLRQHHGLKPRGSGITASAESKIDTGGNTKSVSDIIHSLEAANASRMNHPAGSSSSAALNTSLNSGRSSHHHHQHRPPSRSGVGGDLDATSVHSRDNASVRSAKERLRRRREQRQRLNNNSDSSDSDDNNGSESWLMDEVTGALGPRGIAPDLESLSGRSNRSRSSGGGRSHKSHRSHRSSGNRRSSSGGGGGTSSHRRHRSSEGGDNSVSSHGSRRSRGSRHSRSSRYSHRSTRSYLSQMSEQSRSVANDLLRLEMQLAMVGSGGGGGANVSASAIGADDGTGSSQRSGHGAPSSTSMTRHHASSRSSRSSSNRRAGSAAAARRTRMTIIAPPGRLGIILANRADSRGTVVSGVRTSSVMAEQISPGDRIVAIDGEDVSLMTVSEITTIMTRNMEFERTLTVLTTPRHTSSVTPSLSVGEPMSPRS